jgi:phage terminase small subunit
MARSPRRLAPHLPSNMKADLPAPAAFSAIERQIWGEELPFLLANGFVEPADLATFTLYVQVKARRDRLSAELGGEFIYVTPTGIERQREKAKIMFSAEKQMLALQKALGIGPMPRLGAEQRQRTLQGDLFAPAVSPREPALGKKEQAAEASRQVDQDHDDLRFRGATH